MQDLYHAAAQTLAAHLNAAAWAMGVFAAGFLLAFPVVRLEIRSLLAFPAWLVRLARRFLTPDRSALLLCLFIFTFNSVAIFVYMVSGGLLVLPIVFDLFTGLNVSAVMLIEQRIAPSDNAGPGADADAPRPRAWVGFLSLFVVAAELASFWLSIGMGMGLGRAMRADFAWTTFTASLDPRILAYLLFVVPALFLSAVAETAVIKALMHKSSPAG